MKMAKMAALLGLATVVGTASAQTITQGDAKFQLLTPAFSITNGDTFFYQDSNFTDWQYKYTWYWRQQNNNTNSLFAKFDSPTTFTSGNKTRITFANTGAGANGVERLTGELDWDRSQGWAEPAPASTHLFTRATLGAHPGNGPARVFNFFHLCDMDLPGGVPNPAPPMTARTPAASAGTFTEASSFEFAKITSDGAGVAPRHQLGQCAPRPALQRLGRPGQQQRPVLQRRRVRVPVDVDAQPGRDPHGPRRPGREHRGVRRGPVLGRHQPRQRGG